jgi:2-phosphoglycerate kinase
MTDQELIHRKLTKLIQYLDELKAIKDYTLEEYLDN